MSTATKVKRLAPYGGRAFSHLGSALVLKHEPGETDDHLLLFEMRMPAGNGVPPHTERNHEAWYVLEGTLEVEADGEPHRLGPHEFLSIAPGVLHALRNPGPGWVRALTWVAPGSQHVRFFERVGEPLDDPLNPPQPSGPPDVDELRRAAADSGMDFLV